MRIINKDVFVKFGIISATCYRVPVSNLVQDIYCSETFPRFQQVLQENAELMH
jgi:hypothetical protein